MRRALSCVLLLAAIVYAPSAATEDKTYPAEMEREAVFFSDVLAEYQDLNTRLENVAAPLLQANADLCPRTSRDIGITAHTVSDYPVELQGVARSLLGVTHALSVRTVRDGSIAATAGIEPGDEIIQMGQRDLQSRASSQLYYTAISQMAFKDEQTEIDVRRDGNIMTFDVTPETICGYPVIVFYNENMNGHTDGKEILVTSELLRRVPDDVNLALIIAHELAHAIAGHVGQTPTRELELEADRMALSLMARAGFDIELAVEYWKNAPHPHTDASGMHPSTRERYNNFMRAKTRIEAKQKIGIPLTLLP